MTLLIVDHTLQNTEAHSDEHADDRQEGELHHHPAGSHQDFAVHQDAEKKER